MFSQSATIRRREGRGPRSGRTGSQAVTRLLCRSPFREARTDIRVRCRRQVVEVRVEGSVVRVASVEVRVANATAQALAQNLFLSFLCVPCFSDPPTEHHAEGVQVFRPKAILAFANAFHIKGRPYGIAQALKRRVRFAERGELMLELCGMIDLRA